jgi:hypothetical protein
MHAANNGPQIRGKLSILNDIFIVRSRWYSVRFRRTYSVRPIYLKFKLEVVAGFGAAGPVYRRETAGFELKNGRKIEFRVDRNRFFDF